MLISLKSLINYSNHLREYVLPQRTYIPSKANVYLIILSKTSLTRHSDTIDYPDIYVMTCTSNVKMHTLLSWHTSIIQNHASFKRCSPFVTNLFASEYLKQKRKRKGRNRTHSLCQRALKIFVYKLWFIVNMNKLLLWYD